MRKLLTLCGLIPFSIASSAALEVISQSSDHISRILIASCNRCISENQLKVDARRMLIDSGRVIIGTIEWYSCDMACAQEEARGKTITDMDFASWKLEYERQGRPHLWAQAVKLGARVGVRVLNEYGRVESTELMGRGLFRNDSNGSHLNLLDVRISPLLATAQLFVFVHLLTRPLGNGQAQKLCSDYLNDARKSASHIECIIGPDEIRPSDNRYLTKNPFHLVDRIPESRYDLKRALTCVGPSYAFCY